MSGEAESRLTESVFVTRGGRGRPFPQDDLFGSPTSDAPPVELAATEDEAELTKQLCAHLWPRLHFSRWDDRGVDAKGPIVESYSASLQQLQRFHEDVWNLTRAICEANVEFRTLSGPAHEDAKRQAMERALDEMLQRARPAVAPHVKNVVTAELIAEHTPEQLLIRLREALNEAVTDFAKSFESTLETLVDRQLCGLIEWTGSQTCRYHFFRRLVLQSHHGQTSSRGAVQRDRRSPTGWSQTVTETDHGQHVIRRARHEHHVMHAFHTAIGNSKVVVPDWARRLLNSIPQWLRPFTRIVDGDLVRERIFEQDLKKETWQSTRVRHESAPAQDQPVFGWEPAIIIGGFVLTGWGPREVAAARHQQAEDTRDTQRHRFGRESFAWIWAAVFSFLLAFTGALTATGSGVHWGYVSVLLLSGGFLATLNAVYCHERVMRPQTRWPHVLLVSAAISIVPMALCAMVVAIRST
jgi:hypothetical protein